MRLRTSTIAARLISPSDFPEVEKATDQFILMGLGTSIIRHDYTETAEIVYKFFPRVFRAVEDASD